MADKEHMDIDRLRDLGKKKRKLREEEKVIAKKQYQKQVASSRQITDQNRVFLHITRWHGFYSAFRLFAVMMGLMGLFFTIGFSYIMSLENDDFSIGYVLLRSALVVIAILAVIAIAKHMRNKAIVAEINWIERLPFNLIAFPDFLVYRSYPSFRISFDFSDNTPTVDFILDVLSTLPFDVKYDGDNEYYFRYEVTNSRGSKFNRHRRWAYRWIHHACDNQLRALHEKYPIRSVTIGDGHKELDFQWWIPLRRKGWMNFI